MPTLEKNQGGSGIGFLLYNLQVVRGGRYSILLP